MDLFVNLAMKEAFEAKVEKLNRRAAKLGLAPIQFGYGPTVVRECSMDAVAAYQVQRENRKVWVADYAPIVIFGESPVIEGWRFLATVDLTGTKPMVRRQPWTSNADLSAFFDTDGHCDHCKSMRQRNDVLVLEEVATGKLIQIGRNCAADFFRSKDAAQQVLVSDFYAAVGNYDEDGVGSKYYSPEAGLVRVFETAAAVVRTFGWVSTKMAQADSTLVMTRRRIGENLWPWPKMPMEDRVTVIAEDTAIAHEVIAWLDAEFTNKANPTEFDRSVQNAMEVREGYRFIRAKNLGYLAWAIDGYTRDRAKKADAAVRKAATAASVHVGVVGERAEYKLTLVFRRIMGGGNFGPSAMCKFSDAAGNVFVWWGTNDTAFNLVLNNVYTVKATVKSHDVYEGVNQTNLTRLQVLEGVMKEVK